MNLIFATNNHHKLEEIKAVLPSAIAIKSLTEAGIQTDIPETVNTLEGNALLKANYIFDTYNQDCFADDSGLEVDALNNEPGVYSARYAGNPSNDNKNIDLLLKNMTGVENRKARFRTVIALIIKNDIHYFEGIVNGKISEETRGIHGFGYDPVFIPDGYQTTFAEMTSVEKNAISHRAIAVKKLTEFLESLSHSWKN